MYNLNTRNVAAIGGAAKEIWALIDGQLTEKEIVDKVGSRFSYREEDAQKAFEFLYKKGLVYVLVEQTLESTIMPRIPQKKQSVKWRREFYDIVYLVETSRAREDFRARENAFMLLNNLYGRAWELIDGKRCAAEIIAQIIYEFGDRANPEKLKEFILELEHQRVIEFPEHDERRKNLTSDTSEKPFSLIFYHNFLGDMELQKFLRFTEVPWFVVWEVTYRCNLKCKHCYAADDLHDSSVRFEELSFEEINNVIIKQLIESGVNHLTIMGGEPLVRDDITDIIAALRRAGVFVKLQTNGTFITEEVARRLVEADVNQVEVSLDGLDSLTNDSIRGTGTFEQAVLAIQNLKKTELQRIGICFTVTRNNYNQIDDVPEFATDIGVNEIFFSKFFVKGRGQKFAEWSLTRQQRECLKTKVDLLQRRYSNMTIFAIWHCEAGQKVCCINPTGLVRPCTLHDNVVGDMRKQHFRDIWRNALEFDQLRRPYIYKEVCRSCKKRYTCVGTYCSAKVWRERHQMLCDGCLDELPICV